ncbi:MAG: protein kinase, partial [Gemmatimonadetes bacterium]|nr:protein kinase [Gemmatimonadota bacterium]
ALARAPGDPRALELRGTVLLARAVSAEDAASGAGQVERAERDLTAAVAAEPGLASAWSTLSQVLRYRGRFDESDAAARRALAEDAYLDDADDVLHRLYFGALMTGDYAQAGTLCGEGRRRFRGDWRFVECRLTLLREDRGAPADPALALRLLAELDTLDPPARARREGRGYSPLFRKAVAAAILARAGRADAARELLARAERDAGRDAGLRLSLAYDEAYARLLLGERDSARALLGRTLALRPELRPFAARDPLLRELVGPAAADGATGTRPAAGGSPTRPRS